MTIGDVLAVVAGIIGLVLSGWATIIGAAVLFPRRTGEAGSYLERFPWRSLATGFIVALTAGAVAAAVLKQPNGLAKLIGWMLLSALLALAVIGAGGLAKLVGDRMERMDTAASPLLSLGRGAAVLLVAGLLPLLGWLAIAPLVALVSLGAGVHAVFRSPRRSAPPLDVLPSEREPVA